jgi:hypothetical protein
VTDDNEPIRPRTCHSVQFQAAPGRCHLARGRSPRPGPARAGLGLEVWSGRSPVRTGARVAVRSAGRVRPRRSHPRAESSAESSLRAGQDRLQFFTHAFGGRDHCPDWLAAGGRGSAGRASPCQGEGRGFESRRPLGSAGSRLARRRPARLSDTRAHPLGDGPVAEWPSGLGKGLQSPVRGFDSRFRLCGRLAQRESASLTRKRSLVQSQYRPRKVPGQGRSSNTKPGLLDHLSVSACPAFVASAKHGVWGRAQTVRF